MDVPLALAVAGFGEKLAVTFEGTPEMLSVTELFAPTAVKLIAAEVFDFRLTVMVKGPEIVKSAADAFTVTENGVV